MARGISVIYNEMIAEKETIVVLAEFEPSPDSFETFLADITTRSKVAIWRLLFYVVAVAIWAHEMLWDIFKAFIDDAALKAIPGTLRWYYEQCLVFQYGDGLSWFGNKYQYVPINLENRIIKRAAAVEIGSQVQLKVAKLDGFGVPTPLTAEEKASFENYINKIKFAGTNTLVISEVADLLKIEFDIFYNPLLLNPDGSLITDTAVYPVEDAINAYIQNLEFNGFLLLSKLEDAIQSATGVNDFERIVAQAKYGALAYTDIDVSYNANAGHMAIDPLFPLSASLNYIAG